MSYHDDDNTLHRLPKPIVKTSDYHDVVLCFDTTGSMNDWIMQLRTDLMQLVSDIFKKYTNVKIGIIAHGDYHDFNKEGSYLTQMIDFTQNITALQNFVANVQDTHGGDYEECYEYAMRQIRSQFSWRQGSKRQVLMFGDACPHEFADYKKVIEEFPFVKDQLDWRDEADELTRANIEIVAMQYGKGSDPKSDKFWEALAHKTWSYKLEVKNPEDIRIVITAAVYRGNGKESLEQYEREIRLAAGSGLPDSIDLCLNRLNMEPGSTYAVGPSVDYNYIEETEAQNRERRILRDQERIREGLVVSNGYLQESANRLAADLDRRKAENQKLEEKLVKANAELERASKNNQTSESTIVDLQTNIESLQDELRQKTNDIAALRQEKESLVNDIIMMTEEKEQLERHSKEEKERLTTELHEVKQERDSEKEKNYELELEAEELKAQNADLEKSLKERDEQEWKAAILDASDVEIFADKIVGLGKESRVCDGKLKGFNLVAVKKFKIKTKVDDEEIQTIIRETGKLVHPNLAVIFGILNPFNSNRGQQQETKDITIIMEKTENNLLTCAIKKKDPKVTDSKLMTYLRDAATGLAYLHSENITHKSVRPSNILMVGSTGKLADFGLAGMTTDSSSMYKALELYDENSQPNQTTDVWAMGITILEVLTATKAWSKLVQHLSGVKIPELLKEKKLPEIIDKIFERRKELVLSCLKWNGEERVKSARIPQLLSDMIRT